jgi:hypothetical protein
MSMIGDFIDISLERVDLATHPSYRADRFPFRFETRRRRA